MSAYRGRDVGAAGDLSFSRPAKKRRADGGGDAGEAARRQRQVDSLQALLAGGRGQTPQQTAQRRSGQADDEDEGEDDEDDYDAALVEGGVVEKSRRRRLKDLDDDSDEEGSQKKKPPKDVKLMRADEIVGQEAAGVAEDDGNRMEPFNMNEELEEGDFDETGNYMRKKNANEFRDAWFDSISADDIKKAKEAADKQQRAAAAEVRLEATPANRLRLMRTVVDLLRDGETPMMERRAWAQGLARLGSRKRAGAGRGGSKSSSSADMAVDPTVAAQQQAQFDALTEACDQLMGLGEYGIYQEPRDRLQTQLPVPKPSAPAAAAPAAAAITWRYKWAADGDVFGPFSSEQMAAWAEQGLFGAGVLVQKLEPGEPPADFYSSQRVDFSLYTD